MQQTPKFYRLLPIVNILKGAKRLFRSIDTFEFQKVKAYGESL